MNYENLIIEVINSRDCGVSPKGIAKYGMIEENGVDVDSKVLSQIKRDCNNLVEKGVLVAVNVPSVRGSGTDTFFFAKR